MTALLEQLVQFIGDNPALAGLICFAAAMGEALFIIGLVVPSTVVLVGAGTLIGLGQLEPISIFLWTIAGATVGDALSYWFGYFYKDKVRSLWPLSRYPDLMDRGEAFFREHGGKSVFIGRFVPGVKSVVPGIAGMVGMNATRFTIINVTSAFAWTVAHLGPGIIAGSALGAVGQISGRLAFVLGALLLIGFVIIMLGRWLILIILPLFPNLHTLIVSWFSRRSDPVSKWIAETFDPQHPRSVGMLFSAVLLLVSMPMFFWLIGEIAPGEPMVRTDVAILNMFNSLRSPLGDALMVTITLLGDGVVTAAVAISVALYLFARKAWRRATGFSIAIGVSAIFVPVLKLMLERSRPMELYVGADAFSFPSGHATQSAVLYGIIAVLIAHDRSRWLKATIFSIAAALVIAIGFSRVYLGAHWTSDVLGGWLFGTAMVAAFAFVFGPIHNEKLGRWTLSLIVVLALSVFGGSHAYRAFPQAIETYQPQNEKTVVTALTWQDWTWRLLPTKRIGIDGEREEPLVIQYAGDPYHFRDYLKETGWRAAPRWSLSTASGFVAGETPPDKLPALPRTLNGHPPKMILVKNDSGRKGEDAGRWILHLWPTDYNILNDGRLMPLYQGSVVHEKILRPMGEFSGPKTDMEMPAPKDNPALAFPGALKRQAVDGLDIVLAVEPDPMSRPEKPQENTRKGARSQ